MFNMHSYKRVVAARTNFVWHLAAAAACPRQNLHTFTAQQSRALRDAQLALALAAARAEATEAAERARDGKSKLATADAS